MHLTQIKFNINHDVVVYSNSRNRLQFIFHVRNLCLFIKKKTEHV